MAINYRQGVLYPSDVKELEGAFRMFTTDKENTRIATDKIGKVLQAFGQNPTMAEIKDCIQKYDPEGKGFIEEQQYKELMTDNIIDQEVLRTDLENAFRKFASKNTENKDILNFRQMKTALMILGEPLTEQEAMELTTIVDENHDGQIDVNEFINYFIGKI